MSDPMSATSLGDFASVLQLGVGLHAGTALLQLVAEFAAVPLSRRIERLRRIGELKARREAAFEEPFDDACDLLSDLEVKKIQFSNEYKHAVLFNAGIAVCLCLALGILSFFAKEPCPTWVGIIIIFFSYAPAAGSLFILHVRWAQNTKPLIDRIEALKRRLMPSKAV
jgi:hypothetical protein